MILKSILIIATLALAACTTIPVELTKSEANVLVFRTQPACIQKNLGIVSASSGSINMDMEGNEATSISKIQKIAHNMGANAVVVQKSKFGERQWHSTGVVHHVSGEAIVVCAE